MKKLKFTAHSLADLYGIKVIVSPHVGDDKIVFRRDRQPVRPEVFASYELTVWDLRTGDMNGNCDPTKATEMHVSPKRFDEIKRMDLRK